MKLTARLANLNKKTLISVVITAFLVITIPTSVYLISQNQTYRSRASSDTEEINRLSNTLLSHITADKNSAFNKSKSLLGLQPATVDTEELKEIASRRKKLLLNEIKTNPAAFLQDANLADERASFPTEIQNLIEQKLEADGTLQAVHYDNLEEKKATLEYLLQNQEQTYKLYFAEKPPPPKSGREAKINGLGIDNQVAVASGSGDTLTFTDISINITPATEIVPSITPKPSPIPTPVPTTGRVAVILINFSNTQPPTPVEDIRAKVFTGSDSIQNYYRQNSYDKLPFQGNVFGWVNIDYVPDNACNFWEWSSLADQALIQSGTDLNNYEKKLYVFPRFNGFTSVCGNVLGWAFLGGHEAYAVTPSVKSLFAHELGHTYGADHARSMYCKDYAIDDYNLCLTQEYGDYFDVMGSTGENLPYFSVPHRLEAGWLQPSEITTMTEEGIYTINPQEIRQSAVKALQIRKNNAIDNESYILEYRQPIGFDNYAGNNLTKGVSIHLFNPAQQFYYTSPLLLDLTNNLNCGNVFCDPFASAALTDNAYFYDRTNNILIRQLSHDSNGVKIEVKFSRPKLTLFDFNTDGKADPVTFDTSNGQWLSPNGNNNLLNSFWGQNGDIPVPGDYDGDLQTDIAVWRPTDNTWYIKPQANQNSTEITFKYGRSDKKDLPVPGDYNGDGKTDIAIWSPSDGIWSINGIGDFQWGRGDREDIPVPADYDGDGKTDVAVWRPTDGVWYVKDKFNTPWGRGDQGDIPVTGDFNGDGKADLAVWRPSEGNWYVQGQSVVQWGRGDRGDIPVPADYDGDGKTDVAVWRPNDKTWYIFGQSNIQFTETNLIPALKRPSYP